MANILPEDTKHLVFSYGTLKRNEPNHKFWSVETFWGKASEQPKKGRFLFKKMVHCCFLDLETTERLIRL